MWPIDETSSLSQADDMLFSLAVELGVDPCNAHDVVGAVMSYCTSRHGTTELSPGYLQFLTARSACSANGLPFTREAMTRVVDTTHHPREQMLMMALVQAHDPAALYDVYRRGIIYPAATNLTSSGFALNLDLRRITAQPSEDHPLAWRPALRNIAQWLAEWRQGCGSLSMILVHESAHRLTSHVEMRDWLVNLVRQQEVNRSLTPAEFRWDTGAN